MRLFGLIGPLAGWELRRLARRGQALRVWLLLLYTLVLVLVVFAAVWFSPQPVREIFSALRNLSANEAAAFADRFLIVLLETQLVAIVALTPGLATSAVAEEKDRQTLPLLLTTQLTDREIVFGKAAGRIAFMLTAITASFPLLMLTLFFGKVQLSFLLAGYAITISTVMLCAAIGVHAACTAPDFRSAILRAYVRTAVLVGGTLVPPLVFASPFGVLIVIHNQFDAPELALALSCAYPLVQVLIALLLLSRAARSLRLREPTAGPPLVSAFPLPPRPADPPLLPPEEPRVLTLPPVDGANPILWKERCVGWRPSWAVPSVGKILSVGSAALAMVFFVWGGWVLLQRVSMVFDPLQVERLANRSDAPDAGGTLLTAAGVFAAGRYLLPLALGITGAIAGERFRRTLDVLLSTPLDRRKILRAKLQAHIERGTAFAAIAVAAVGMAFTADADVTLGITAAVLMLSGFGLVIGLGAYLTVYCATDVRAFRLILPLTMVAVGWPVGAWNLLRFDEDVPRPLLVYGLQIVAGVWTIAGVVLWWLAERRLVRGE